MRDGGLKRTRPTTSDGQRDVSCSIRPLATLVRVSKRPKWCPGYHVGEIVLLKMANDRGRRLPAYVVFRTQRISGGREPTLGRSARRPRGRPASSDPGRPFCFAGPCLAKRCL